MENARISIPKRNKKIFKKFSHQRKRYRLSPSSTSSSSSSSTTITSSGDVEYSGKTENKQSTQTFSKENICNCVHCDSSTAFEYLKKLHPENFATCEIIGENTNSDDIHNLPTPLKCKYGKHIHDVEPEIWNMHEYLKNIISYNENS